VFDNIIIFIYLLIKLNIGFVLQLRVEILSGGIKLNS